MRIGVDLGGTKIEAVALARGGAEILRERVPSPRGNYDHTIRAIRDIVLSVERRAQGSATVGIGIPGAISPRTGLVKNANSTRLNGKPLDRDLTRALSRPVRIANDANCFALSEASDGAGAGRSVVFGVILGTGVGGGIVVDGKVLSGANAIGGEWGHNPLPRPNAGEWPGPDCYCGRKGCIETWLSGPAFAAQFAASTGRDADPAEIAQLAANGDAEAEAAFADYEDRLGRALATVVNVVDPDVVVLGGGLSNIERLYAHVPEILSASCFSDGVSTPIVKAKYGDSSGVRGAAWLWREEEAFT